MQASDITVFIQALRENAQRLGLTWSVRPATVLKRIDEMNVFATYDGDSVPIKMTTMVGVPKPNARVYAVSVPPAANFIVGYMTSAPVARNLECIDRFGTTSGTTTSATFVDINASTAMLTFVKAADASRVDVDLRGTLYVTTAAASAIFGVKFAGPTTATYNVTALSTTNTLLNNHSPYTGRVLATGLPAGTYTVTAQWRRGIGTGTLNIDSGDILDMCIEEVP